MSWRELTKEELEEMKQHYASQGYVMQWYVMASAVILTTLGPDWWKANCLTSSKKPDEFMSTLDKSESGGYDHQERMIKLGDMLYGLKGCAGYAAFIESLKRRDLEAAYFELCVADILVKSGFKIEFIETSGVKEADYDLKASKEEVTVTIEAKCRRSEKILNQQTLQNALKKARAQLPRGGPSIIFVLIPVEWTFNEKVEEIIKDTINSFLKGTTRVNNVIIMWQQWLHLPIGRASCYKFRSYENLKPSVPLGWSQIVRVIENPVFEASTTQLSSPSFW